MWRSLVACLNGVQEAGGSNPLTQTTASEQSPLCSGVFFAFGRCICRNKAAVAPLPCSSFSAKGPARLACSLASALTTARCRYQPFAAAAPCGAGDGAGRACRTGKRATRRSKVRFAPTSFLLLTDCICRKKAAVASLSYSSFSAKGPACWGYICNGAWRAGRGRVPFSASRQTGIKTEGYRSDNQTGPIHTPCR